jgi:hypothetical protein
MSARLSASPSSTSHMLFPSSNQQQDCTATYNLRPSSVPCSPGSHNTSSSLQQAWQATHGGALRMQAACATSAPPANLSSSTPDCDIDKHAASYHPHPPLHVPSSLLSSSTNHRFMPDLDQSRVGRGMSGGAHIPPKASQQFQRDQYHHQEQQQRAQQAEDSQLARHIKACQSWQQLWCVFQEYRPCLNHMHLTALAGGMARARPGASTTEGQRYVRACVLSMSVCVYVCVHVFVYTCACACLCVCTCVI